MQEPTGPFEFCFSFSLIFAIVLIKAFGSSNNYTHIIGCVYFNTYSLKHTYGLHVSILTKKKKIA